MSLVRLPAPRHLPGHGRACPACRLAAVPVPAPPLSPAPSVDALQLARARARELLSELDAGRPRGADAATWYAEQAAALGEGLRALAGELDRFEARI